MTGKTNKFVDMFDAQCANQTQMLEKGLYDRFKNPSTLSVPADDVGLASYHIQQLMSEIGEVLDADKRWKSHRNEKYDKDGKIEEIADCFIVLMNVAMFSGFTAEELENAIMSKLISVAERIDAK